MTASSASIEEEISFPPKLRPKPQERWIGPGKAYADHAAFDADLAAYKEEKAERAIQVKKRERALDRRRDRSNRQRDQEHESDAQRRVRQRKESEAQSAAHIKREAERTAQKRRAPLLVQQEAWAADVAVFAAVFDADEPRKHPLAYSSHRSGDWLSDGRQIQALHNIIARGSLLMEPSAGKQLLLTRWRSSSGVSAIMLGVPSTSFHIAIPRTHPMIGGIGRGACAPTKAMATGCCCRSQVCQNIWQRIACSSTSTRACRRTASARARDWGLSRAGRRRSPWAT